MRRHATSKIAALDWPSTLHVEVIDEPLRQAMIAYSWRILGLSIVISLVTATLIFLALLYLLHTTGELFLSPVGLSMITKLSPVPFDPDAPSPRRGARSRNSATALSALV